MSAPIAYYNEIDPYAAQWLRNLIEAGHIATGVVDERSIEDVKPDELMGYTQCHFFAGIGVWSLALRRAGWPDNRPVWTGSCPCQPFSEAGKGAGFDDERHLWPSFQWLIEQCRPSVVFGEQVASKAVDTWIDLVHADLEALGYAFGGVPFPSAGVGSPHIRDRLYWVADAQLQQRQDGQPGVSVIHDQSGRIESAAAVAGFCGDLRLANTTDIRLNGRRSGEASDGGYSSRIEPERLCDVNGLANPEHAGHGRPQSDSAKPRSDESNLGLLDGGHSALEEQSATGPTNGFWRDADWLGCRDGKWRPVEPGTFPLANGSASRVGRLRAYGNAINAAAAQVFIESFMEGVA